MATAMSCGTGNWAGPLPGDPDNNSILSAVPAFGGIDVSWTYPNINPHAVAHVMLYRGITSNYAASVKQATVTGSTFYDRITGTAGTRYYYWIQIVSVNGTVGTVIGPASAIARSRIEDTIVDLTGQIDQSALAIALKTEIGKISLNYQSIIDEVDARIADNSALSGALSILNSRTNAVETFVVNEITQRKSGDAALVSQFTLLAAANQNNTALIAEERTVRVTAVDSLAQAQTALNAQMNHSSTGLPATRGTLLTDYYTKVKADEAIATSKLTLDAAVFSPTTGLAATRSSLINDYYTKSNTDSAIASATSTLASKSTFDSYTTTAALELSYYTKTAADSAISTAISKVGVTGPNGNFVGLQQTMSAQYVLNSGYSALYTMKLSNNGLIGGFGLANDGITVEAGFDVDKFWVGRTSATKKKPFIITNNEVYIDNAFINKLTADKIDATSLNVVNGTFSGSINLGAFTGYAWPAAGQGGAHLSTSGLLLGNFNGSGHYFQIDSGLSTGKAAIYTNIPAFVSTLNIGLNQVTVPNGNSAGGYGASATITVNAATKVICVATFYGQQISWFNARILRDGIEVVNGQSQSSGGINPRIPITVTATDSVSAGTHTYTVDGFYTDGNSGSSSKTTLFVMAAMR